jgi:hypothetical protein
LKNQKKPRNQSGAFLLSKLYLTAMEVYIKSFGRPYYLHRCIQSIYQNLEGQFRIIVLDDGTSVWALDKICKIFPEVEIRFSPLAPAKRAAIEAHCRGEKTFRNTAIPYAFWAAEIAKGGDYFLLLEEDGWLTASVDAGEIVEVMQQHNILITKLFWGNSLALVDGLKTPVSGGVELVRPRLPLEDLWILKPLLGNILKIRSVLARLKVISPAFLVPYYNLYTVASAIFRKDYWQYCTTGAGEQVDEPKQLLRAVMYHKHHPESRIAKSICEKAATTYVTAAYNGNPVIAFDMIKLNQLVTAAWEDGGIDAMQGYPRDFDPDYLAGRTTLPDHGDVTFSRWQEWITAFRMQYRSLGMDAGTGKTEAKVPS